jgi:hypothetical protein
MDALPEVCSIYRQKWPEFGAKDIAFSVVNL